MILNWYHNLENLLLILIEFYWDTFTELNFTCLPRKDSKPLGTALDSIYAVDEKTESNQRIMKEVHSAALQLTTRNACDKSRICGTTWNSEHNTTERILYAPWIKWSKPSTLPGNPCCLPSKNLENLNLYAVTEQGLDILVLNVTWEPHMNRQLADYEAQDTYLLLRTSFPTYIVCV